MGFISHIRSLRQASLLKEVHAWNLKCEEFEKAPGFQLIDSLREDVEKIKQVEIRVSQKKWNQKEEEEINFLKEKRISLEYRDEIAPLLTEDLLEEFTEILRRYKKDSTLYPGGDGLFTENDRIQIQKICEKYPLFAKEMISRHQRKEDSFKDPLTKDFVTWSLRSGCSVGVFVKTPHERRLLMEARLDQRTGTIHGTKGIKFITESLGDREVKILSLLIDGEHQKIQGIYKKNTVYLSNLVNPEMDCYQVSIEEVIQQFKDKDKDYGSVEYFEEGVCNWSTIYNGSYNPQTKSWDRLDHETFLEKAPVVKRMTFKELQTHYEGQSISKKATSFLGIRATRAQSNFFIADNHAFIEYVRKDETGLYEIFPFGLQPFFIPPTIPSKLAQICNTMDANLHFPDESFYLSQRQKKGLLFSLNAEEEQIFFEEIQTFFKKSDEKTLFFQPMGDNCAYFAQKVFTKVIASEWKNEVYLFAEKALHQETPLRRKHLLKKAFTSMKVKTFDQITTTMLEDLSSEEKESLIVILSDFLERMGIKEEEEVFFEDHLKELLMISFEASILFKRDIAACEYASVLQFASLLKWIPSSRVRRSLTKGWSFLFGGWRAKKVGNKKKTLLNHPSHQEVIHLPAHLWTWEERQEALRERLLQLNPTLRASSQ